MVDSKVLRQTAVPSEIYRDSYWNSHSGQYGRVLDSHRYRTVDVFGSETMITRMFFRMLLEDYSLYHILTNKYSHHNMH